MSRINCYGDEENYGEVLPGVFLVRLVNVVAEDPRVEETEYSLSKRRHYQDQLVGQIYDCYRLWSISLQCGYNPEVDGYCLGYWLRERIALHPRLNPRPVVVYHHRLNLEKTKSENT